uniref:Uncharacterized protein n=1 Tax=Quercus lobata TaxID=97700 RepID=A0A7N2MJ21_QUELO
MHGFDYSVPYFITRVRGTRIAVTLQIVADVLRVPRVEFPDYPSCESLRTVSKEEIITAFCERPSDWDIYRDTATRDKLIFPSAITGVLRHFDVRFSSSDPFPVMGAIDACIVKRNKAQFHSRRSESIATPTPTTLSTSAPFSSTSGVILEDIMAQFQRMDARLNTLSDELCQSDDSDGVDDDDAIAFDDEIDGDASSPSDDEMST